MRTLLDCIAWITAQPRFTWTARWWQDGELIVQTAERQWGAARYADGKPALPLQALGCTGRDAAGVVKWVGVDIDVGHGVECYSTSEQAVEAGMRLVEWCTTPCELRYSKSGEGLHFRAVPGIKCAALYAPRLAKALCESLSVKACPASVGRQAHWLWARQPAERGYALIAEKGW